MNIFFQRCKPLGEVVGSRQYFADIHKGPYHKLSDFRKANEMARDNVTSPAMLVIPVNCGYGKKRKTFDYVWFNGALNATIEIEFLKQSPILVMRNRALPFCVLLAIPPNFEVDVAIFATANCAEVKEAGKKCRIVFCNLNVEQALGLLQMHQFSLYNSYCNGIQVLSKRSGNRKAKTRIINTDTEVVYMCVWGACVSFE